MKERTLTLEFVEFIPDMLEEGKIYVSMQYATVVHKCCCGCGKEVVTPLSPTDWKLTFDGKTISLDPSIGNWSFSCKSHYWIRDNAVRWSPRWSQQQIDRSRSRDRSAKERYYGAGGASNDPDRLDNPGNAEGAKPRQSFRHAFREWWQ